MGCVKMVGRRSGGDAGVSVDRDGACIHTDSQKAWQSEHSSAGVQSPNGHSRVDTEHDLLRDLDRIHKILVEPCTQVANTCRDLVEHHGLGEPRE